MNTQAVVAAARASLSKSYPGSGGRARSPANPRRRGAATGLLVFPVVGTLVAFPPLEARAQQRCPGQWLAGTPASALDGTVTALAAMPNGDLIAGGAFTHAGGLPVGHIARWDGAAWSPLGSGTDGQVWSLAVLPGGDLVAGGTFLTAGGITARQVARWNGSAWTALGNGPGGTPNALVVLSNGQLIAGGNLLGANVLAWSGSVWTAVGGVNRPGPDVWSLWVAPGGDLIAGGNFAGTGVAPANTVARWDGSSWLPMGWGPAGGTVLALTTLSSGDLVAGGQFSQPGGATASCVAAWNGSAWSALGSGVGPPSTGSLVHALAVMANGDLVVGGRFELAGAVPASNVARWNGTEWSAFGSGLTSSAGSPYVWSLAVLPTGELVAGGGFTDAGGNSSAYWARWRDASNCYANCDCSGVSPVVNVADFTCFLQQFAAGAPYANCDGSTQPPLLNVVDFTCFLQKFAAGCP